MNQTFEPKVNHEFKIGEVVMILSSNKVGIVTETGMSIAATKDRAVAYPTYIVLEGGNASSGRYSYKEENLVPSHLIRTEVVKRYHKTKK